MSFETIHNKPTRRQLLQFGAVIAALGPMAVCHPACTSPVVPNIEQPFRPSSTPEVSRNYTLEEQSSFVNEAREVTQILELHLNPDAGTISDYTILGKLRDLALRRINPSEGGMDAYNTYLREEIAGKYSKDGLGNGMIYGFDNQPFIVSSDELNNPIYDYFGPYPRFDVIATARYNTNDDRRLQAISESWLHLKPSAIQTLIPVGIIPNIAARLFKLPQDLNWAFDQSDDPNASVRKVDRAVTIYYLPDGREVAISGTALGAFQRRIEVPR